MWYFESLNLILWERITSFGVTLGFGSLLNFYMHKKIELCSQLQQFPNDKINK